MKKYANNFSLKKMATIMQVSRSGYYRYIKRGASKRDVENIKLNKEIKQIYQEYRGLYGSPRIYAILKNRGIKCSRKRVAKLMKAKGLRARMNKKFKVRKKYKNEAAPDRLNQNFHVGEANRVWVADICYIKTKEGTLYLAAVMDLFSRKIVGFSIDDRMRSDLVKKALAQAFFRRRPGKGLVHHSDRGSQYTSRDFKNLCKQYFIEQSMTSRNCYDNAAMESFFHTLKTELVYLTNFETKQAAKTDLFEYIEGFYNRKRLHSTLGYVSPESFEANQKQEEILYS